MQDNIISLIINNKKFTGWKSVRILRSLEAISGKFTIELITTEYSELNDIIIGNECKAVIGSDILINGYIDRISGTIDSGKRTLTITGRDKTSDIVDCSVSNSPSEWKNVTILQLVNFLLQPFNLKATSEVNSTEKFIKFACQTGEKVIDAIGRACNARSLLVTTDTQGNAVLTNVGRDSAPDSLQYGINIKRVTHSSDYTGRYSNYTVLGQTSGGGNPWVKKTVTQIKGTATDENITRFRPFIKKAGTSLTTKDAGIQASWEANTRAGKSDTIMITVVGYRMSDGRLWKPNCMVQVYIPQLSVNGVFLITDVEYMQSAESGSECNLTIRDRGAFSCKPPKLIKGKKKKKIAWKKL